MYTASLLVVASLGVSGDPNVRPIGVPATSQLTQAQRYGYLPGRYLNDDLAAEWLRKHYGTKNADQYFGIPYGRRGFDPVRHDVVIVRFVANGLSMVSGQPVGVSEYPGPTSSVSGQPMAGSDWHYWYDRTFPSTYP